jgi:ankyrin repeat protein
MNNVFQEFCEHPINVDRIIDIIRYTDVSVDECDEDHGDTLLMWSCAEGLDKLTRFLVRNGADLNVISHVGGTALDRCMEEEIIAFLRAHGAKTEDELRAEELANPFAQFCNGDVSKLYDWLSEGLIDKDARDEDHGESLLIWACRHAETSLVEELVEMGCDLNLIAHSDGLTALDICQNRLPHMADLLRRHSAKTADEVAAEEEETMVG